MIAALRITHGESTLIVYSVIEIALIVAALAFYLAWVGTLLTRIATNLETCGATVREINGHAELIAPGISHINRTGGIVSGALPLLYNFAEDIIVGATPAPEVRPERGPALPASGHRRSRMHDAVGYEPGSS